MDHSTHHLCDDSPQSGADSAPCIQLLVVDDDARARTSLARLLTAHGFCVTLAGTVDEALERLTQGCFEVMLLDIMMPNGGGGRVLDQINCMELDLAVVVVTGTRSVPEATRVFRHGAHDLVCKPYRIETLLQSIADTRQRAAVKRSRTLMQARLRASERLHRFIVHHSPDLIFMLNDQGRLVFVNDRFTSLLKHRPESLLGRPLVDLVVPAHRERVGALLETLQNEQREQARSIEVLLHGGSGMLDPLPTEIKLLAHVSSDVEDALECGEIFGVAHDLTEHYRVQETLRRSKALLEHVITASPAVIYARERAGDHAITFISSNIKELLGYEPDQLLGRVVEWDALVHPDDLEQMRANFDYLGTQEHDSSTEYRMRHSRLGWRWVRDTVRLWRDPDGQAMELVGSLIDNTESHLLSEHLVLQASLDALTGLFNRRAFEHHLTKALESARDRGFNHALCYLDLDQFKVINDTCGHVAGDAVLRQLAHVLEGCIRGQDILARLGGDEFGILMERCSTEGAMRVAELICKTIGDFRFVWGERCYRLGASIGLVMIDSHSEGIDSVLSAADSACYAAKDAGRNRVHVYTQEDTELARRHGEMQWVSRINLALEQNRFLLVYQPIAPVTRASTGLHYELLLRMRDEQGNVVMPGAFLPAAERYHLAVRLDQWVLDKAIDWLSENPAHIQDLSLCSINLSGHSLGDQRLLERLTARLRKHDQVISKLCLEITETAAIANMSSAINFIQVLRDMGCQFALDDFGSGLSSFAYLKNLPVDFIKIDGMFVEDIATNPVAHAMVKSINEIGQVMGMKTIAEFVENEQTLDILRGIGVDFAQGYGIGRPRPIEEFKAA